MSGYVASLILRAEKNLEILEIENGCEIILFPSRVIKTKTKLSIYNSITVIGKRRKMAKESIATEKSHFLKWLKIIAMNVKF